MKHIIKKLKSESEKDPDQQWSLLPEPILIKIFKLLTAREILNASEVCRRWNFISHDSLLWKSKFHDDFLIDREVKLKPSKWGNDLDRIT